MITIASTAGEPPQQRYVPPRWMHDPHAQAQHASTGCESTLIPKACLFTTCEDAWRPLKI